MKDKNITRVNTVDPSACLNKIFLILKQKIRM